MSLLCSKTYLYCLHRKFDHDNIVEYYGTAVRRSPDGTSMQLVMLMELCETTLRSRITGPNAISPGRLGHDMEQQKQAMKRVAAYISQTACALMYLHDRLLVHRDLKPQNILVSTHAKLCIYKMGGGGGGGGVQVA